jgi:hypothetical protein
MLEARMSRGERPIKQLSERAFKNEGALEIKSLKVLPNETCPVCGNIYFVGRFDTETYSHKRRCFRAVLGYEIDEEFARSSKIWFLNYRKEKK